MDKKLALIMQYSDKILDIVDNRDNFTRSDLQSCIEAIIMNLLNEEL